MRENMKARTVRRITDGILSAVLIALVIASIAGPLSAQSLPQANPLHPPQPDPKDLHRVLYNGKPVLLAGYYPGLQALIVEPQVNAANPTSSTYYKDLINTLADDKSDNHINLLRVVLTMGMALEDNDWLHPYNRSGTSCSVSSGVGCNNHAKQLGVHGRRFNLNSFNQAFFDYWDDVLAHAEARDVIVQVALVDGAHLRRWTDYHIGDPKYPPFEYLGRAYDYFQGGNNTNNLNIEDRDSPNSWYDDSDAQDRVKDFIDEAVRQLGGHNNIIWEIQNEPQVTPQPTPANSSGHPWFGIMRNQIQSSELAAGHPEHMIMPYDSLGHRDVGGHRTPGKPSDNDDSDYQQAHNDMVVDFGQFQTPIIADNDCCVEPGTPTQLRKKAWTSLVSGAQPSMLVYNVTGGTGSAGPTGLGIGNPNHSTQRGIRYTGFVRKLVMEQDIDLRGMNPRDDLLSSASPGGYVWCLARESEEYIVYFYNAGSAEVLSLPSSWEAKWFNPVTGATTTATPTSGTHFQTPTTSQDWVLYVKGDQEMTATVTPLGDSFVAEEQASVNYGSSSQLEVRYSPLGSGKFSFLKFNVPAFSGSVTSATLRMRTQGSTIVNLGAYKLNNMSWNESQINWLNWDQSGAVSFSFLSSTPSLSPNTWHNIDVTNGITGSGEVTLGLATGTDVEHQDFWSDESSYRPRLIIQRSGFPNLTVYPSADSWVSENQQTANFGSLNYLRVRYDPTYRGRYSFVRFDVPSYTGTLVSAKLRIRSMSTPIPNTAFFKVNGMSFNEGTINWLNWDQEGAVTFNYLGSESNVPANYWTEFDVTSSVTGPGNELIMGLTSGTDLPNLRYYSSESSHSPELVITYQP